MQYLKNLVLTSLMLVSITAFSQKYSLPNEVTIFSFQTSNGKTVALNKDKENKYLIYRFGTKDKIEFQFPDTLETSWKKFKYTFWMRGGGTQNEGLDLNYIEFTNKNFKYVIYDTYFATGNKQNIGVKIIDLTTNKITDVKGIFKTRKGTLVDFRENGLLEMGDELFD